MSERRLTVSRFSRRPRTPLIRLHGDWLAALGFQPGDRLAVQAQAGRLILRRLGADQSYHNDRKQP